MYSYSRRVKNYYEVVTTGVRSTVQLNSIKNNLVDKEYGLYLVPVKK